jgi:predicted nucleic acid-binding OB-fold protein
MKSNKGSSGKGHEIQAFRDRARPWGKTRKQTRKADNQAAIREQALVMDFIEAGTYLQEHNASAKGLGRRKVAELRENWRTAQAHHGQETIYGGPETKDEFINAILELEYPRLNEARTAYSRGL